MYRIYRICQIARLIEYLADTLHACCAHGDHDEDHREHHQAHEDVHTVGQKAHQLTGRQLVAYDHFCARPADQDDTGIDGKLHQRSIDDDVVLRLHKDPVNVFTGFLEAGGLMFFADVGFYDADRGYIFLYGGVQLVVFRKCHLEVAGRVPDDEKQDDAEEDNGDQVNACEPSVDCKRHDQSTDHARRSTHHHAEHHLVGVLDIGDVSRQTGHKPGCAEFVDVGKGKCLDMTEHALAQVLCQSG